MPIRCLLVLFASIPALLAGCGGGPNPPPIVSDLQNPLVRAINLIPGSAALTVTDGSATLGAITAGQATAYHAENAGLNAISFVGASGQAGSFSGQLEYGGYDTVAICSTSELNGTFAVPDIGTQPASGTSLVRVANAIPELEANAGVYVTAGSHSTFNVQAATLISGNGIAFGAATAYKAEAPGVYTVTVTSAVDPSAILLNQVVTLQSAQAITVYALNGSNSFTSVDGP